jgi:hypothetical protein
VSWAGSGPVPAWLDQARELSEYWIHRQQLLQGLGRPSDLAGRRSGLAASGDGAITGILLRTRAIIGEPKWA